MTEKYKNRKCVLVETTQIAVQAIYDSKPSKVYDANARPDPNAVIAAKKTLSPIAWRLYENLSNFPNHGIAVAPIVDLMKEVNMDYGEFNRVLAELISNKYLSFTPIIAPDCIYEGNTFRFHPDNTLVGTAADANWLEALKKKFYYNGTSKWKELW